MRGNVGDKFKGISGFVGATELDNVELTGDVDIDNLVGIPGIRPPVPLLQLKVGAADDLDRVWTGHVKTRVDRVR